MEVLAKRCADADYIFFVFLGSTVMIGLLILVLLILIIIFKT